MRIIILDSSKKKTSLYGRERILNILKVHPSDIIAFISSEEHYSKKNSLFQRIINKLQKRKSLFIIDFYFKLFSLFSGKKKSWLYSEENSFLDFRNLYDGPIYNVEKINSKKTHELIKNLDCDLVFHTGGMILKDEVLSAPRIGVIGYHHGDIEKYRGPLPCFWELINNEKKVGVTIQLLNKTLDTGPILLKKHFDIDKSEKLKYLQKKIFWNSSFMASEAISLIKDGNFHPVNNYKLGKYRSYPNVFQVMILAVKGRI
ncbi:formyltransferase family protein [Bacteroidota bacterium]